MKAFIANKIKEQREEELRRYTETKDMKDKYFENVSLACKYLVECLESNSIPFKVEDNTIGMFDSKISISKDTLDNIMINDFEKSNIEQLYFIYKYLFLKDYFDEKRIIVNEVMKKELEMEKIDVDFTTIGTIDDSSFKVCSIEIYFNEED